MCAYTPTVELSSIQFSGSLMIPFRVLSRQAQVYPVLSASFALAALQNVTVDNAVLTGAMVPQYLPSDSVWNIGNNCTACFVKPDPSLAYNGTWHDTTTVFEDQLP
ncbi:hypothetical protein OG21DRAFT_1510912 [Imleria badia]|nr:hypothetical protein OG21DRAFT_1510912 [Imleria badia]